MKKILLALVCMGLMFGGAPAALAEHANEDHYQDEGLYDGDRWSDTVSEGYCFDGFGIIPDPSEANAKSTTVNQINTVWEADTDINTDWYNVSSQDCSQNLSYQDFASPSQTTFCTKLNQLYPGANSRVDYDDLPAGTLGVTRVCDRDGNGKIDFFWIIITDCEYRQPACPDFSFHWNVFSSVQAEHWDYAGVFTHEMGHATGFDGHWTGSTSACTPITQANSNTMCDNTNLSYWAHAGSTGEWYRNIAGHDIGEVNAAYPP